MVLVNWAEATAYAKLPFQEFHDSFDDSEMRAFLADTQVLVIRDRAFAHQGLPYFGIGYDPIEPGGTNIPCQ